MAFLQSNCECKCQFNEIRIKIQWILLDSFIPTIIRYLQNPWFAWETNQTQRQGFIQSWNELCNVVPWIVLYTMYPSHNPNPPTNVHRLLRFWERAEKRNILPVNKMNLTEIDSDTSVQWAYSVVLFIAFDHQSVSHFGTNHHQFTRQWIICIHSRRRRRLCFIWYNLRRPPFDRCATRNHAKNDFIFDSLSHSQRNENQEMFWFFFSSLPIDSCQKWRCKLNEHSNPFRWNLFYLWKFYELKM